MKFEPLSPGKKWRYGGRETHSDNRLTEALFTVGDDGAVKGDGVLAKPGAPSAEFFAKLELFTFGLLTIGPRNPPTNLLEYKFGGQQTVTVPAGSFQGVRVSEPDKTNEIIGIYAPGRALVMRTIVSRSTSVTIELLGNE